ATLVSSTVTPRNSRTNSTRLDADRAVLSGYPHILQFLVSPLDPQVVWLQTNYRALLPPNCLAQVPGLTATLRSRARAVNTLAAPLPDTALSGTVPPPCIVQFFSTDGGQHWTQTASTTVFTLGHVDPPSIWVQGQRLYAKAYVNALSSPATATYLMTSMDGGTTWTRASDGIGNPICDVRPAPAGSTVFAVTGAANDCFSSATIWRSDDTGKHWTVVSRLDLAEEQIYVAVGNNQPTPVVYLFAASTGAFGAPTTTLIVSLDGGRNWNPAPTPRNQSNLLGALQGYTALTSDGRLIAVFSFDETANHGTLYSWRVGDPQWSPIGPAPQTDATSWAVFFLAIPSLAGGSDALWYATNPSDLTMEFYRLQL
ncbi:MAG TPA: sialidase family protein, partial [Ktedonobacterales bacterium]|nr:sialidase family protein [Ktedonobacterales bacterium]